MALGAQEQLERLAQGGIVLDDQDRAASGNGVLDAEIAGFRREARPFGASPTSTAKTEPLPSRERRSTL